MDRALEDERLERKRKDKGKRERAANYGWRG